MGLQRRFECHGAYEMFQELKLIFQANARVERYEISNKFYNCKMEENSSISEHILKMSGYHNHLTPSAYFRCVCLSVLRLVPSAQHPPRHSSRSAGSHPTGLFLRHRGVGVAQGMPGSRTGRLVLFPARHGDLL